MKKVLIADWLDAYGGAERVIKTLNEIFSFDKTYTLICLMKKKDLNKIYPNTDPIIIESKIKFFKKHFRYFFFLFHYFIKKIKIDSDTDLIISSSHSISKGVRKTNKNQIHISYFQARNFNYIWEDSKLFFGLFKPLFFPLIFLLRKIDVLHSKNPDYIIVNSVFVKDWVMKRYNRDSVVIYPPVDLSNFNLEVNKENYYVAVGRIVTVKKFDILVKAFNILGEKLIIIGDGKQLNSLKKIANSNIIFTGFLTSEEVNKYVSKAKAFMQPGVEGFGIATLEALACGTPVVAYGKGGVLETVVDKKTGLFFYQQNEMEVIKAIKSFQDITFNYRLLRSEALKFSEQRFKEEINIFISHKINEKEPV